MNVSLRRRLLVLLMGATVLVWAGTVVATWIDARHEIDEVMDAHLAQAAALLVAQLSHDVEEIRMEHVPVLGRDVPKVAFQIWEHGDRLRLHSSNAPDTPLGTRAQGFGDHRVGGVQWRVFTTLDRTGEYLIHVGERTQLRDRLARELAEGLVRPLLIALPLLALLLWIGVDRGLRPLASLTAQVGSRDPGNLVPLDMQGAPRETLPLINQLNRLFGRIAVSVERERRFTADAAHELRTPVAAIKAQAQVAQMAAAAQTREHAIAQVVAGADRASRLVEQLLTLARVDTAESAAFTVCDLRVIAAEVITELAPAAAARNVRLELTDGDAVAVQGIPGLLQVLTRNLIDNAVRHGATLVQVEVTADARQARLAVADNGPGIPEAERENVLQRFYRLGSAGEGGSGLGLSIVQRIVQIHRATLTLGSRAASNGLCVHITFPKASAEGTRAAGPDSSG